MPEKTFAATAPFVSASFTAATGTLLENYTSDVGGKWVQNSASLFAGNEAYLSRQNVFPSTSTRIQYFDPTIPEGSDYDVEATATVPSSGFNNIEYFGIAGRVASGTDVSIVATYGAATPSPSWQLWSRNGGGTELSYTTTTLVAGATYHLKLSLHGTLATFSVNGTVMATGTVPVSTGYAGVWFNQGSGSSSTDIGLSAFKATNYTNLSVSTSSLVESSTNNTVTLTGIGTSWTAGTPGNPSFQISSTGSGASIVSQTINSSTTATLVVNAGSAGTITIGDATTGNTASITVAGVITLSSIGSISGNTQVGQTLTAGVLAPSGATATYQWLNASASSGTYAAISGATLSSYVLQSSDLGKYLEVIATGSGSYAGVVTSTYIGPVIAQLITAPFVSASFTAATGTLLENYTSDVGGKWVQNSASLFAGHGAYISGQSVFPSTSTRIQYFDPTIPEGSDYDVEATATVPSSNPNASEFFGVAGRIASGTDAAVLGIYTSGQWGLWARNNGGTQLGYTATSLIAGATYHLKLSLRGTLATFSVNGTVMATGTVSSSVGYAGNWFYQGTGSSSTDIGLSSFKATNYILGSSLSASTSSLVGGSTNNTITLTGIGTSWTAGIPGNPSFQISSTGSGASIVSQTINSSTTATLVVNAGIGGTIMIGDGSSGNGVLVSVSATPTTTVAINDSHVFFSPYNWWINGSTFAQTNNPGAYIKVGFTGTSIALALDQSAMLAATASGSFPMVRWKIDSSSWTSGTSPNYDVQIPASGNLTLATGLAPGNHTLYFTIINMTESVNRWNTPNTSTDALRITGFTIDQGSSLISPSGLIALLPKRLIIYGDSITAGKLTMGNTGNDLTSNDASVAWWNIVATHLNAEVGAVAYRSQGWQANGLGNVPYFYTSGNSAATTWDKYDATNSRLSAGSYSPVPDYIIENMGTNDQLQSVASSSVRSSVSGWLSAARAAAPNAQIFLAMPYGVTGRTYAAYIKGAVSQNTLTRFIDLDDTSLLPTSTYTSSSQVFSQYLTANYEPYDSLHPIATGQTLMGNMANKVIDALLSTRYLIPASGSDANLGTSSSSAWATFANLVKNINVVSASSSVTSTQAISFFAPVNILLDATTTIVIPASTTFTAATTTDFTQLSATTTVDTSNLPANYTSQGVLAFGLSSSSLALSQAVTITIPISASYEGQTLAVFRKEPGETSWTNVGSCTIGNGTCTFSTPNLSSFVVASYVAPTSVSTGSSVVVGVAAGYGGAVASTVTASSTATSSADTASLRAQLNLLVAQLTALQAQAATVSATSSGEASSSLLFTKDLYLGIRDGQVWNLQHYLNTHGFPVATTGAGSLGNEIARFGKATQAALIKFQAANDITPSLGYFGPITRAWMNAHF